MQKNICSPFVGKDTLSITPQRSSLLVGSFRALRALFNKLLESEMIARGARILPINKDERWGVPGPSSVNSSAETDA
jgi:hypothetical protein